MKNALVFIAFVFLLTISIVGQEPGPPPPAAPDYTPQGWKEYSYPEDNIRFRFPVKPIVEETIIDFGERKLPIRSYKRKSFMEFSLYVIDHGSLDLEAKTHQSPGFLDGLVMSGVATNKILKKEDINIEGHPGKVIVYETAGGQLIRSKMFVIKNKLYSAGTSVKKGQSHGVNWENDFEKPSMAFLDSIRLISN